MDIYNGSFFRVETAGGLTGEIPQERECQARPLSPLLFNLIMRDSLGRSTALLERSTHSSRTLRSRPRPDL